MYNQSSDKVNKARNKEIVAIVWTYVLMASNVFIIFTLGPALILTTFSIFFASGNTIDLGTGFACLQVLNSLNMPIRWIPQFIGTFLQFTVSMRRIQKFLVVEEINPNIVEFNSKEAHEQGLDVLIEKANFSWGGLKDEKADKDKDKKKAKDKKKTKEETKSGNSAINDERSGDFEDLDDNSSTSSNSEAEEKNSKVADSIQIKDLNLKIHKGEFICVIGGVGSGKSSLISAILGDMIYMDDKMITEFQGRKMDDTARHEIIEHSKKFSNKVKLGGNVSYVQQTPWIQNKTIRDNILFGLPMDEKWYNETIELCELESDLEILPGGDLTEIGEKGINLSGGQKARVSLARAVYSNRDIVLMDDPISALDSNVKKSIFQKLFLGNMRGKTRILVTHAVEFLDKVDRVIIMEKGKIKHFASYEELKCSEEIQHIIKTLSKVSIEEDKEESKVENLEDTAQKMIKEVELKKSFVSEKGTKITDDENDEKVNVGWGIYAKFFLGKLTWVFYLIAIPLTFLSSFSMVQNSITIGKWIDREHSKDKFWEYFFQILFFALLYATLITVVSIIISLATVRMSKILHHDMLDRTAHAPINLFFDKTPSGRILNRYSSDINKLDNAIDK